MPQVSILRRAWLYRCCRTTIAGSIHVADSQILMKPRDKTNSKILTGVILALCLAGFVCGIEMSCRDATSNGICLSMAIFALFAVWFEATIVDP